MRTTKPLIVDLTSPADARAKLPEAELILQVKEAELREAQVDVESFRRIVETIQLIAGATSAAGDHAPDASADDPPEERAGPSGSAPSQQLDLVVSVVDRELRPIRARDVADTLRAEGHDVENSAVSNSLFYGAVRATPPRIRKLHERGMYAPLRYQSPAEVDFGDAEPRLIADDRELQAFPDLPPRTTP